MDEIKPALTAEEWRVVISGEALDRDEGQMPELRLAGGGGYEPLHFELAGELVAIASGRDRHAVAAVALHRQPFGFTWEDVDTIRDDLPSMEDQGATADYLRVMRTLADRIAALLPPREP